MKLRLSPKRNVAMTLFEVCIVLIVLAILAAIILPVRDQYPRKAQRINCVNNLKQVGLAFRLWGGDNNDQYPMEVFTNASGVVERPAILDVAGIFQALSNELGTARVLYCPSDTKRFYATNFDASLNSRTISYFIGLDAREADPEMILSGDDNLLLNGVPVKSGLITIPTNAPISWSAERHKGGGNIGLADGSVEQVTTTGLQEALKFSNSATNHLAIP